MNYFYSDDIIQVYIKILNILKFPNINNNIKNMNGTYICKNYHI